MNLIAEERIKETKEGSPEAIKAYLLIADARDERLEDDPRNLSVLRLARALPTLARRCQWHDGGSDHRLDRGAQAEGGGEGL